MPPLLNDAELAEMRAWRQPCGVCGADVRRNYCRQCDEFFFYGHKPGCAAGSELGEHAEHRTYESPSPTGKAPQDLSLTGQLFPWLDGAPVFTRMPFSPSLYLPCFRTARELRRACRELGIDQYRIKQITNGAEFLSSIPPHILVITGIRFEPGGRLRFVQVLRD